MTCRRGGRVDTAELLMDEADLEEATPQANVREALPYTCRTHAVHSLSDNFGNAVAGNVTDTPETLSQSNIPDKEARSWQKGDGNSSADSKGVTKGSTSATQSTPASSGVEALVTTDVEMTAAAGVLAKRAHEETLGDTGQPDVATSSGIASEVTSGCDVRPSSRSRTSHQNVNPMRGRLHTGFVLGPPAIEHLLR
ncbi:hypothetical protein HPB50_025414 [Hyalomma asiaticum]|uniref:Uncharacterized protein n=1 Tax=Hyalomma asiaticum TaxID=266040 RepID=A0ACB7TNM1_HYAAI|nr:hypothetical protein HPB50_025414 [Hyalomma asiaticum]